MSEKVIFFDRVQIIITNRGGGLTVDAMMWYNFLKISTVKGARHDNFAKIRIFLGGGALIGAF